MFYERARKILTRKHFQRNIYKLSVFRISDKLIVCAHYSIQLLEFTDYFPYYLINYFSEVSARKDRYLSLESFLPLTFRSTWIQGRVVWIEALESSMKQRKQNIKHVFDLDLRFFRENANGIYEVWISLLYRIFLCINHSGMGALNLFLTFPITPINTFHTLVTSFFRYYITNIFWFCIRTSIPIFLPRVLLINAYDGWDIVRKIVRSNVTFIKYLCLFKGQNLLFTEIQQ